MLKMRLVFLIGLLLISLSLSLAACSGGVTVVSYNSNSSSGNVNGGGVANNGSTGKKAGPASLYPNPKLTPGDALLGVTAKEVCVSGYSSGVRDVTSAEKAAVYQEYGIPNVTGQHEVDHFISLELGGSNDIKNLWPEPYEPKPGAHEKDKVEDALHAAVCAGQLTLPEAQRIISEDWYAYYLKITPSSTK
jgi:hypothetical protein